MSMRSSSQQSIGSRLTGSQITSSVQKSQVTTVYKSGIVESRDSFHERQLHKRFLGQDLDVACFLLAVENERLYDEVHSWRIKYERSIENVVDRGHYEKIIEELNVRIFELSSKLEHVSILEREIQDWRQRYEFLRNEKDKEIDTLRRRLVQVEEENSSLRGLREKVVQLEDRNNFLTQENEKWRLQSFERGEQISKLIAQKEKLEQSCIGFEAEIKRLRLILENNDRDFQQYRERISKYESTIGLLESELVKYRGVEQRIKDLQNLLDLKDREIADQKNKYSELLRQLESYRILETRLQDSELRNQSLIKEIEQLKDQLDYSRGQSDQLKKRITQLEIEISHLRQFEVRTQEYEERIALLTQEIERLNSLLHRRLQEIEQQKSQLSELNVQLLRYKDQIQAYESQLSQAQSRIQQLSDLYNVKSDELEQLRILIGRQETTIKSQEKRIEDLENQIVLISSELDRLNQLNDQKSRDLEAWRIKYSKIEIQINEYRGLEGQLRDYEQRIQFLNQSLEESKNRIRDLERANQQIRVYEQRIEEYENKIALLSTEIDRLNDLLKNRLREIEEWRQRYNQQDIQIQKYKTYEQKMIEYENRVALMSNEIERLNQVLRQRSNEIDEWKTRYANLEANSLGNEQKMQQFENRIVMLSQEIERLSNQLKDKNNELEQWRTKYYRLSDQVQDYEKRIGSLQRERDQLSQSLRDRSEEIENWKIKYSKQSTTITSYIEMEENFHLLKNEINRLNEEIKYLTDENAQLKKFYVEKNSLEVKLQENLCLCVQLFAEIESLRSRVIDKEREVEEIRRSSIAPARQSNIASTRNIITTTTYSNQYQ